MTLAAVPVRRIVWLLPAAFLVHELEEWNIMTWYRAARANPPDTPDAGVRTLLIAFAVLGFVWTAVACSLPTPRATAHVALPFFVPFVFTNNLQHVYWLLAFGTYAPGVVASVLLGIPAVVLVSWHARRNRLVGGTYLAVLYVLSVPPLVVTMGAGRTMSTAMLRVHALARWLAEALGA